jgi:hypothetical protein
MKLFDICSCMEFSRRVCNSKKARGFKQLFQMLQTWYGLTRRVADRYN